MFCLHNHVKNAKKAKPARRKWQRTIGALYALCIIIVTAIHHTLYYTMSLIRFFVEQFLSIFIFTKKCSAQFHKIEKEEQ